MDWLDFFIKVFLAIAAVAGAVTAIVKLLIKRREARSRAEVPKKPAAIVKSMKAGRDFYNVENSFNRSLERKDDERSSGR